MHLATCQPPAASSHWLVLTGQKTNGSADQGLYKQVTTDTSFIIIHFDLPPWQQKIFSSMIAAMGRQLKQSVNVFHSLMLYRRLPERKINVIRQHYTNFTNKATSLKESSVKSMTSKSDDFYEVESWINFIHFICISMCKGYIHHLHLTTVGNSAEKLSYSLPKCKSF